MFTHKHWFRSITYSLMFLCVFMLSQITWSGEWAFDFEDPKQADQWKVANGTWKIQNGVYSETSAKETAAHVLFGEADWADYTVEARIRLDAGGKWAGLVVRAISEYEYYIVYPEPTPGNAAFFQHHGNAFDKRARPEPNKTEIKGTKITEGTWFHFKIVVKGNDLKWFIDNQLQAETKLAKVGDLDVYKKGKVGIWAWQTKASFDDFKVSGPGIGNGATAVDPRRKLATTWSWLKQD